MAKYRINYVAITPMHIVVEADSEEDALAMCEDGRVNAMDGMPDDDATFDAGTADSADLLKDEEAA